MEISYLKIQNYRNFRERKFEFEPEGTLILGRNGIGKTNLLEAIAYLAFGKSFQNSKDAELINFSKAFFRLEGRFKLSEKDHFIEAAADKNKKIIKIDEINISRISELYQFLKVVYFSPADINIIGGAPSFRRSFIDQAISQYSFKYIADLRRYNRILKQRNALLKEKFDPKEKRSWDEQFAHLGAAIIQQRLDYMQEFIPVLVDYYARISGFRENLDIKYDFSFPHQGDDIRDDLFNHMEESVEQEIHYERSLCGPHLDDIELTINDHLARNFASQGQKRSLSIAARLVQANLISSQSNEPPILMFDDVLSDLDKERSKEIINLLQGTHQIFIATPNSETYKDFNLKKIDLEN
ncbi:MAG: DNA replication/repair protein RecF [Candidatus Cloacimonadales bacterium]|nr:DNA replication/repair protein RecF [Candidatus Cloacimonadales bacterium]